MAKSAVATPSLPTTPWARWMVVTVLAAVLVCLWVWTGLRSDLAGAQSVGSGGQDGIYVVAGQISRETYGLFLVDYDNKTICVYQYLPTDRNLRLMAARTYRFDVQLDAYNSDSLTPQEVKQLVEQQQRLGIEP